MDLKFTVNGKKVQLRVPGAKRLLDILREDLGFLSVKEGCSKGECGVCSVIFNGRVINACLMLACQADGSEITTLEGLSKNGKMDLLQEAFVETGAIQCGFCTPGLVVASRALLNKNPDPTEEDIRDGLSGNLCRCTGYTKIVAAVKAAIEKESNTRRGDS
ncbi:MAG TPA: (2Fe-2S)-binding protein [Bacteroidetes bacterium]|nr:(2Fe-2S)-binding protein [Bacteroidota bacterium]